MPTLRRRIDDSRSLHPRQTPYYILANPPDAGNITYQVDERAATFLTDTCGYGDGESLPWSLVHPLRQIRDLFTLDEGRPRENGNAETTDVSPPSLDASHRAALVEYLRQHPDVSGDLGSFETRLKQQKSEYIESLRRTGYTPTTTPGHETTGTESLDRIAEQFFGDGEAEYITWDGERHYEYIEVETREGETKQFPTIEERLPEGERLRLSRDLYRRWGPEIGASEVVSRRYDPDQARFPNEWIGQREGSPEPSLKDAKSPRAFYYRTIAGRSGHAPGTEAEEEFDAACDYSLEVYKANFPSAVDPTDLTTEYVTIEEAVEPWNDFQVPPGWLDRYDNTGGLPPLKRADDGLSEREHAVIDHHLPSGDGSTWFESREEGVELVTNKAIGGYLIGASEAKQEVSKFYLGGYGQPVFEVELSDAKATIEVDGLCRGEIPSAVGGQHSFHSEGELIPHWELPDVSEASAKHRTLEEQSRYFPPVAEFVASVMQSE